MKAKRYNQVSCIRRRRRKDAGAVGCITFFSDRSGSDDKCLSLTKASDCTLYLRFHPAAIGQIKLCSAKNVLGFKNLTRFVGFKINLRLLSPQWNSPEFDHLAVLHSHFQFLSLNALFYHHNSQCGPWLRSMKQIAPVP
jgi:hypothetical protein